MLHVFPWLRFNAARVHPSAAFRLLAFLLVGALPLGAQAQSQGVGIGTTAPNAKAALDIVASDKGLLIPRLDSAQRAQISSPPQGLMVYQKDGRQGLWYFQAPAGWQYLQPTGDNLGNHTATRNLDLGAHQLVGNGGTSGVAIDNSGHVGIGTTTPRGVLDVAADGDTYLSADPIAGTGQSLFLPGHIYLAPYNGGDISYLQARRADNSGTTALRLRTYDNGALTDALHIAGNGSVGIGTNDPLNRLDVQNAGRSGIHADGRPLYVTGDFAEAANGVEFRHSNGTQGVGIGYNSLYAAGENPDQNLNLIPKGSGGVGIGTTTPSQKLDVAGNAVVSGNVGIGTTTPSQQLDVVGTAVVSGNVGIGTTTPAGQLQVVTPAGFGPLAPDQVQLVQDGAGNGTRISQTFTVGVSGQLQRLIIYVGASGPVTVLVEVFAGTSTSGPALVSQSTTIAGFTFPVGPTTLTFASPIAVTAGQVYGYQVTSTSGGSFSAGLCSTNCYAGGEFVPGLDMAFQTLVAPAVASQSALLVTGGNVGIGTTAPTQKLQVAGTIYSTSGGYKFPDGTTQTTAATGTITASAPLAGTGSAGSPLTIAPASGSANGYLSSAAFTTFSNKLSSVTTTGAPFTGGGTGASPLGINTASGSQAGVLTSTDWTTFNNKGTFTLPALTSGSVLFSNGSTIAQSNGSFFWDNANARLGLGTSTPTAALDVNGATRLGGLLTAGGGATMTGATTINATGNASTNIGTGGGPTFLGGSGGTFVGLGGTVMIQAPTSINVTGSGGTTIGNASSGSVTVLGATSINATGSAATNIGTGTGPTTIGGSGGTNIGLGGTVTIQAPTNINVAGSGATTIGTGGGVTNINTGASSGATNIGTGAGAGPVTLGRASGTVTVGNLAGTGTRVVTADATGNLTATQAYPTGTNFIQNQTTQQASSNFNVSGTGTVGGLLTATSGATVQGSFNVSGPSLLNGALTTSGPATVGGNAAVSGTFSVSQASTLNGLLTANAGAAVAGPTSVAGATTINTSGSAATSIGNNTGALTLTGPTTVNGATTITGNTGITGNTAISGNTAIGGNATVSGSASIGTSTAPDASAALDVVSSSKGALLPRLTAAARLGIASPAPGLLAYQTDAPISGLGSGTKAGFWYNSGTAATPAWVRLTDGSAVSYDPTTGLQVGPGTVMPAVAGNLGGTPTTTTNASTPYRGIFNSNQVGCYYTAAQLTAAGLVPGRPITTLGWNVTSKLSGAAAVFTGFSIKLGNVASTPVGTSALPTGLTTVFSGNVTTTVGLNTHSLTTPFSWNGTDGLYVLTCFSNTGFINADVVDAVTIAGAYHRVGGSTSVCGQPNSSTTSGNALPVLRFTQAPGSYTLPATSGLAGQVLTQQSSGAVSFQDPQWTQSGTSLFPKLLTSNVGIGTASPSAPLHVAGLMKIDAANTLEFGAGVAGKEVNAGKIGYQTFSADALDIVGAGTGTNRKLAFYNEGGASFNGSVGIGTATPNATALLDVSSTSKGLLPPRMSQTQRDAIAPAAAAAGLLVYNTTTSALNAWNGTAWTELVNSTVATTVTPPATTTFAYTGATQTYTVPAGVTSLQVTAQGGGGGSGNNAGGAGARVVATVAVTPGETLTVEVGGGGGGFSTGGASGYNGGGAGGTFASGAGVGGGGATDLRRALATGATGDYLSSRNALLVAAGGGGGADQPGWGGNGGTPSPGGNGTGAGPVSPGQGATQAGPGAGGGAGYIPGQAGNNGTGGNGTDYYGTGGGGGYYGGGGSGISYNAPGGFAGGGGGSSWVMPTGSSAVSYAVGTTGNGYLTITTPTVTLAPAPTLDGANISGAWDVNGTSYYHNTGNVGIGTGTPAEALDVTGGNVKITTAGKGLIFPDNTVQTTAVVDGSFIRNQLSPAQTGGFNVAGAGTVGGLLTVGGGASLTGTVAVSGNVGIGTTSPQQKLEVAGTAAPTTVTTAPLLRLSRPTTNGVKWSNTFDLALGSYATGINSQTRLDFNLGNGATNTTDVTVMTLNGNGNVGIGTTAPTNRLDIQSTTRTGTHGSGLPLYVTNTSNDASNGVEFRHTNGTQGIGFGFNSIYAAGSNPDQHLNLMAKGTGGVGIGTVSPAAKLDVNGYLRVAGANTAPATGTVPSVAFLTLTATLPSAAAAQILVPHGLTDAKIIGMQVLVDCGNGNTVPAGFTDNGSELFHAYLNGNRVVLRTGAAGTSASVLGKPARILLTYQP